MYVAVPCSPMRSHLGQMEVALRLLGERGHRVELWGGETTEALALRAGLGFRPLPDAEDLKREAERVSGAYDYYARFSFPLTARQLPRVLEYCREDPPDLLHSNTRVYTAIVASLLTGVPAGNHSCNGTSFDVTPEDLYGFRVSAADGERKKRLMLALARDFHTRVDEKFHELVGAPFGMPRVEDAIGLASRKCVLVLSIRELANPRLARMRHVHFTGPLIEEKREGSEIREEPGTYCYVTLRTWPMPRERTAALYRQIIAGLCPRFRVIVGLGGRLEPEELRPPDPRVTALGYAPQTELIRGARFVVCHGGCQTVNEALYFGKPVISIPPPITEPLDMTYRAVLAGACIEVRPDRLSSSSLREAVEELLSNGRYAARAAALGRRFRETGGADMAAGILEEQFGGAKAGA